MHSMLIPSTLCSISHIYPVVVFSGMSGSIPSFDQPSERYEDLFQDDDLTLTGGAIAAVPISQAGASTPAKVGSTLADKRRFSQGGGSLASTPETRSSKRIKSSQPVSPSQDVAQFYRLSDGQIPLEVITGWSKLKTTDTARAMLFSSGESFFHHMRLSSQLAAATRGDVR